MVKLDANVLRYMTKVSNGTKCRLLSLNSQDEFRVLTGLLVCVV